MAENEPNLHPNLIQNGNILAHQYEIVRRMLRYLPMRDLLTCCQVCKLWNEIGLLVKRETTRYEAATMFWSGECTDVSYYSSYPLFQSPHHHQMYHQMETLMSNVMIKPKLAVIVGSGDTELSVRDSKPGLQPDSGEDHMEESWLVDKSSVTARLPKDCFSIGTTCRGIVGMKDGAAVELENLFDENNLLCPAMSMLLIPEKPGCKILPFYLAENQLDGYIEEIRKEWVYPIDDTILQEKILEKAIPDLKPEDEVRAVILLRSPRWRSQTSLPLPTASRKAAAWYFSLHLGLALVASSTECRRVAATLTSSPRTSANRKAWSGTVIKLST